MLKKNGSLAVSAVLAALAFIGLTLCPSAVSHGARRGIEICLETILPSLFPFMVVGSLITELGLTAKLSKALSPATSRLFGVSGAGAGAFFLGLTGGYPLGAVAAVQLNKNGSVSKSEAERLLGFCDNTGPAFIIGVAGGEVFKSSAAGIFLYGVHIAAAILTGMLLCWKEHGEFAQFAGDVSFRPLPEAFSASVKRSVSVCGAVCGFVVFFCVVLGLLEESGLLMALMGRLSEGFGLELGFSRSLLTGLMELGGGISSMKGMGISALNLALSAFILGFGGLSVQAQALSAIAEGGLSAGKHLWGKLLHGFLSALLALIGYPIFF